MKASAVDPDLWHFIWSDSEIAGLKHEGDTLILRFAAASVSKPGGPSGYLSDIELIFHLDGPLTCSDSIGANLPLTEFVGGVAAGAIRHSGKLLKSWPLPSALRDELELDCRLISGSTLSLRARSLQATVATSAVFRESWAC